MTQFQVFFQKKYIFTLTSSFRLENEHYNELFFIDILITKPDFATQVHRNSTH